MLSEPERKERFGAIARADGSLAIVANDQRESLRTLLVKAGRPGEDDDLSAFKVAIARMLSPLASAILIDPLYGLAPARDAAVLAPTCGLIVAADQLHQRPGEAVHDTSFDHAVADDEDVVNGAQALKLLVLVSEDGLSAPRRQMVADFTSACQQQGVLSVVEGVVRAPDGGTAVRDHAGAVVMAARELGSLGPDLYKAEVPTLGEGPEPVIRAACEEISAVLACPWVVLSGGVAADAFPAAVDVACRAGASGFLAGRGIWGPAIEARDPVTALATDAATRLRQLIEIVDDIARPWSEV